VSPPSKSVPYPRRLSRTATVERRDAEIGIDVSLFEPDTGPDIDARNKALQALGVLVLVAAIATAIVVVMVGTSRKSPSGSGPAGQNTGGAQPVTSSAGTGKAVSPTRASASVSAGPTPATASAASGIASCPTPAPCVLPGDAGQAGSAVTAFRVAHQLADTPVSAAPAAQSCALASGDQASCPGSYFWEPVASLDGAALLAKISATSKGSAWLVDPRASSFTVGWAYAPGANGKPGQISGALIKIDGAQ
jgi:hypothetical protein